MEQKIIVKYSLPNEPDFIERELVNGWLIKTAFYVDNTKKIHYILEREKKQPIDFNQ